MPLELLKSGMKVEEMVMIEVGMAAGIVLLAIGEEVEPLGVAVPERGASEELPKKVEDGVKYTVETAVEKIVETITAVLTFPAAPPPNPEPLPPEAPPDVPFVSVTLVVITVVLVVITVTLGVVPSLPLREPPVVPPEEPEEPEEPPTPLEELPEVLPDEPPMYCSKISEELVVVVVPFDQWWVMTVVWLVVS